MDNSIILTLIGFFIGVFGTLIGAGGGFLLVPLLLLTTPQLPPDIITGISIAIVAANAISGSISYAISKRIDYKAGIVFAIFTIPGSVLGVFFTDYIPKNAFNFIFGLLLLFLSSYLFVKNRKKVAPSANRKEGKHWKSHTRTDRSGAFFSYSYNQIHGIILSILVGFLSPLLGIGGGIIHVPAMVQWLQFPVYVTTATSHFILAIMSFISVLVHACKGDYNDPKVLRMIVFLCLGVLPGAQLGAYLSHKISTNTIIKVMAVCLAIVGIRVLVNSFQ